MRPTTYYTEEPCPSCGHLLVAVDDGSDLWRAECRACGYAETWDLTGYHQTGGASW